MTEKIGEYSKRFQHKEVELDVAIEQNRKALIDSAEAIKTLNESLEVSDVRRENMLFEASIKALIADKAFQAIEDAINYPGASAEKNEAVNPKKKKKTNNFPFVSSISTFSGSGGDGGAPTVEERRTAQAEVVYRHSRLQERVNRNR